MDMVGVVSRIGNPSIAERHHFARFFDNPAVLFGPKIFGHFIDFPPDAHYSTKRTMRGQSVPG
jgi:hypothetical protein